MPVLSWIILCLAGVSVVALVVIAVRQYLTHGPSGSAGYVALWYAGRVFCRLAHRVNWTGLEHVPDSTDPGPLIVVSNHTGGVDPLLISAAVRFKIRWMMAAEYVSPEARWFWDLMDIIPVSRTGRDLTSVREAIRHVKSGGVIGIFPEGGIVNPPGEIRAFVPGVGLIVSRTKAPVLLVWVSGTARADTAFGSVTTPSRAQVEFVGMFDLHDVTDAEEISRLLREKLATASGWPLNDEPVATSGRAGRRGMDPFAIEGY